MKVVLKEEYEITNARNDVIVHLIPGFAFTSINPSYVPKDSDILVQGYSRTRDELAETHYIFYVRATFVGVPKKICEIPKSNDSGWGYNI